MNLDQLRRAAAADPGNPDLALELLHARARVEGAEVLLECPTDRERWQKTHELIQDAAAREVARRLPGLKFVGMREWSCETDCAEETSIDDAGWCTGAGVIAIGEGDEILCPSCRGSGRASLSHRLATFRHKATGMEMQLLPGHELRAYWSEEQQLYVSRDGEPFGDCNPNDWQIHPSSIAPFLIGRWPVTTSQKNGNGDDYSSISKLPVTEIDHLSAMSWCKNRDLRLPAAAEWTHACRAGTTTRFPWGDEFDPEHVWYAGNSAGHNGHHIGCPSSGVYSRVLSCCPGTLEHPRPHAPAEHDDAGKWSAFGLVDMIGNVWEWCADRLVRGGAFYMPNVRIVGNTTIMGGSSHSHVDASGTGFRAACSIPTGAL